MLTANESSVSEEVNGRRCTTAPVLMDHQGSNSIYQVKLRSGSSKTLSCRSSGEPRPVVHWLKDGKHFTNKGSDKFRVELVDVKSEHGGTYTCRVTNSAGSANVTFIVTVHGRTAWISLFLQCSIQLWFLNCFYILLCISVGLIRFHSISLLISLSILYSINLWSSVLLLYGKFNYAGWFIVD